MNYLLKYENLQLQLFENAHAAVLKRGKVMSVVIMR